MSDPQRFHKGTCSVCGGRIEFPATADGMSIECPHCHQQTQLLRTEEGGRGIAKLLIFALIGVALAGGVLFFLQARQKSLAPSASPTSSNAAAPAPVEPARPKALADLKVTVTPRVEKAEGRRLSYAIGVLKNDSDHPRYGVRVELDVFDDKGNKLSTQANDYVQQLEPRKEWKFRALLLDAKAASAKVAAIREED